MHFSVASALAVLLSVVAASPVNVTESLSKLVARGASPADIANSLAHHNAARAAVGVAALVWDTGLQNRAQAYADTLARTPGGVLQHSGASENLWWSSAATDHDLLLATDSWVNEKPNYHNELIPQGNFQGYGHYSELRLVVKKRLLLTFA